MGGEERGGKGLYLCRARPVGISFGVCTRSRHLLFRGLYRDSKNKLKSVNNRAAMYAGTEISGTILATLLGQLPLGHVPKPQALAAVLGTGRNFLAHRSEFVFPEVCTVDTASKPPEHLPPHAPVADGHPRCEGVLHLH